MAVGRIACGDPSGGVAGLQAYAAAVATRGVDVCALAGGIMARGFTRDVIVRAAADVRPLCPTPARLQKLEMCASEGMRQCARLESSRLSVVLPAAHDEASFNARDMELVCAVVVALCQAGIGSAHDFLAASRHCSRLFVSTFGEWAASDCLMEFAKFAMEKDGNLQLQNAINSLLAESMVLALNINDRIRLQDVKSSLGSLPTDE
ncbi:hypothetical protein HDU82_002500, partial [Entophlyctis luteolus]